MTMTRRDFLEWAIIGASFVTAEWKPLPASIAESELPQWYADPQSAEEKFLEEYVKPAIAMERRYGIPKEIALTTAATETEWGKSTAFGDMKKHNNVLGLGTDKGGKAFTHGGRIYAIFSSDEEAFMEYGARLEYYNMAAGDAKDLWKTDQVKALQNMFGAYYSPDKQSYISRWEANFLIIATTMSEETAATVPVEEPTPQPKVSGKTLVLVAGHWILPGRSTGAPFEREMNMEIANELQPRLERCGWKVRRPDLVWLEKINGYKKAGVSKAELDRLLKGRENSPANYTSWSSYLNQTRDLMAANENVFWWEIHGQGWTPKHPYSLGSIGDNEGFNFARQTSEGINNYLYPALEKLYSHRDAERAISQTRKNNGRLNLPLRNYGVTNPGRGRKGVILEVAWSNMQPKKGDSRRKPFVKEVSKALAKTLGC